VWEWCQSLYRKYPYDPNDGRERLAEEGPRVLRGGAFYRRGGDVRCAARRRYYPNLWDSYVGFRLVVAPG
jgi:formylglycine-generating enzyme required for sulfatase activity